MLLYFILNEMSNINNYLEVKMNSCLISYIVGGCDKFPSWIHEVLVILALPKIELYVC